MDDLTLERLLPLLGLDPADVLNVYLYGSRLWGKRQERRRPRRRWG
jgi:hypothetical protein